MSDTSSLTELARFVGQSQLVDARCGSRKARQRHRRAPAAGVRQRQRVSDLLAVVLTLSARTRRMVLPQVEVELDVFAPGGQRAVRMHASRIEARSGAAAAMPARRSAVRSSAAGLGDDDAVAAARLGLVDGGVGRGEQHFDRRRRICVAAMPMLTVAAAGPARSRSTLASKRLADALGDRRWPRRCVVSGSDEAELLAAHAEQLVGRPDAASATSAKALQHAVAGLVAEAVVDRLEVIEIEHQQRHGAAQRRRGGGRCARRNRRRRGGSSARSADRTARSCAARPRGAPCVMARNRMRGEGGVAEDEHMKPASQSGSTRLRADRERRDTATIAARTSISMREAREHDASAASATAELLAAVAPAARSAASAAEHGIEQRDDDDARTTCCRRRRE